MYTYIVRMKIPGVWVFSLIAKILHSPLSPSVPWLKLHQAVLFDPNETMSDDYHDILLVDYVPAIPVTPEVVIKIGLGQSIPGKTRFFFFDSVHKGSMRRLLQERMNRDEDDDMSNIKIQNFLVKHGIQSILMDKDEEYNLYTNNCIHFASRAASMEE